MRYAVGFMSTQGDLLAHRQRRFTFKLFSAVLLLSSALALKAAAPTHIVLMHTNDIHGHLLPDNGNGGLAVIATIVKQQRPDLLLDAGDMFAGSLLADSFSGEPVIAAMNLMGYAMSVLGNHEFDFGPANVRARIQQAKFPILSANVKLAGGRLGATRIVKIKGVRFGLIGLSTEETPTSTHPKNVAGITFAPAVQAVGMYWQQLKARSDFVVVVGHLSPAEELAVARAFPEIPLIVSGHSHAELKEPIREGSTAIVRTGTFGRFVGRIDMDFEGMRLTQMTSRLIEAKGVEPDRRVLETLRPWQAKVEQRMNEVLGEATAALPRWIDVMDSPLCNLITDAIREKAGSQIAITNTEGIRTDLPPGPITYGRVFEILPFENTLITVKLTGAQVRQSLSWLTVVSGLRVVYDTRRPANERLVSVMLADGSPLVDSAVYSVAANDFMLAGGDNYTELAKGSEIVDTGLRLRDVVSEYITKKRSIAPLVDGRIQILR